MGLLLQLTLGCILVQGMPRDCSSNMPAICSNATNIRISKERNHYQLKLCLGNQCVQGESKWIKCDKMCDACKSILTNEQCNVNERQCEAKVVRFLGSYCASNTPTTHTRTVTKDSSCTPIMHYSPLVQTVTLSPTCTSFIPHGPIMKIVTHTVSPTRASFMPYEPITRTVTVSPTCTSFMPYEPVTRTVTVSPTCTSFMPYEPVTRTVTVSPTCTSFMPYEPVTRTVTVSSICTSITLDKYTQTSVISTTSSLPSMFRKQMSQVNESALVVFGVFLALLVIALAAVSTGLMWTIWTLKKERSEKAR